jgi:hypothetical protein
MTKNTRNTASADPQAAHSDQILAITGHTLPYWGLAGHTAHLLSLIAERAAKGDPAGARDAMMKFCLESEFNLMGDEVFLRLVLMTDAVITMAENGETVGTAVPPGATKH